MFDRTDGESKGRLRFYTKQTTGDGDDPVEVLRCQDNGGTRVFGDLTVDGAILGPTDNGALYLKSDAELAELGVSYLPRSLGEAIDAFEADDLCREVMGDLMFRTYTEFKRAEWDNYLTHVSDWEVDRYLKLW